MSKKFFFQTLVFLWASIFSSLAFSQTLKAGDLEKMCLSSKEDEKGMCLLITKIYMDGFIEGTAKGVLDVYKFDSKVYEDVKDVKAKDFQPRLNDVMQKTNCLKSASVSSVSDAYLDYLKTHTSERSGHYRNTMTRTILQYFCERK